MKIQVNIDHAESLAAYQAAGHGFPTIPAGKNTIWHHFSDAAGRPALIINQRGFSGLPSDDEQPLNGCSLAIALDAPDPATARATLEQWVRQFLATP
jgi:hypothetical protein